jgi:SAM-dependent methyltransferase
MAPGDRALDLGCGSGTQALCLMEEGFRVVAADLSVEATRVARATNERAGRSLAAVNADAERLPFADVSLDACVCGLLLHHFKDMHRVAAELRRVVRPGGVVVALDANGHNPPTWLFLNGVHRLKPLKGLTPNQRAIRSSEIREVFTSHGFADFQFRSVTSALRKDWLGDSLGARLNYHARAALLGLSNVLLPQVAQGNMLLSRFRRAAP